MSPRGRCRKRTGFTLVEVMMALAVVVLVFMSSLSAITIGFRILEDARMSTLASQVLQSEMENLRLKNWAQLGTLPESGSFAVETSLGDPGFDRFACTRTIRNVDAIADVKEVALDLSWTSMSGAQHNRRYVTYMAKDGLHDYYYRRF
jgi:prepilin-type N-terminal cleavage/methylation domain-containing protein